MKQVFATVNSNYIRTYASPDSTI